MTDVLPPGPMADADEQPGTAEPVARVESVGSRFTSVGEVVLLYVVCISSAIGLAMAIVWATGGSPMDVLRALINGSIWRPGRWGLTLGISAPILLVAVGTIVNSRAGLINIGQEGQLVMGAVFATYVGVRIGSVPGPLALVLLLLAGVLGGAIWAGIAGVLRYWRNVPEVLSTLLMGVVAANVMGFALQKRWLLLAPAAGRANRNQVSEPLKGDRRLPRITWFGNEFPFSVFIAIALAIVVWIVLERSVAGFRLRVLGRNRVAARRAGVVETKYGIVAMLISGGFSGLAGGMMLTGGDFGNYQLVANFGTGIGFAGLLVALVARQKVLAAIFVAFVFGSLRAGSGFLKSTGLSARIADVVQGMLVLSLLLPPAIIYVLSRRRAMAAAKSRT